MVDREALRETVSEHVDPGTSVLLSGPVHGGQLGLCFDVLTAGHTTSTGFLFVSTDLRSAAVVDAFGDRVPDFATSQCRVVDARGDRSGPFGETSEAVASVSSPSDLTGIGIEVIRGISALRGRKRTDVRLGIHSLSTLVEYLDPKTVFKFLHTLTGRCAATDISCLATLNEPIHDAQVVNLIASIFDVHVQIREVDDGFQLRILGMGTGPTRWMPVGDLG